ncbi:MAG: hypothetical protein FWE66_03625 [Oscillospiraceae bacterium]|nr:hypothetical protein [Oscillospiraceae bacterium]
MWFNRTKKKKSTWTSNRSILLPFISIVVVLLFMYFSPAHNVLTISSHGQTFLIFAMKEDESFEVRYYDVQNGVDVVNTLNKQGNGVVLRTMEITGNSAYVPYKEGFPGADFMEIEDGYLISGLEVAYNKIELTAARDAGYVLGFRERLFYVNNYVGDSAVVSIGMRKVSLLEVMRYDPGYGRGSKRQ